MGLYSERIETLIEAALIDGEITDKERQVLLKKAKEEGIDPDEFEMVLNARCVERGRNAPTKDKMDPPFSIPKEKEALLEFMSSLKPKLRISERYVDIYEECVHKVKRLFPNDRSFDEYTVGFDDTANEIRKELQEEKEEKKQKENDKTVIILLIILIANGLLGCLLLSLA